MSAGPVDESNPVASRGRILPYFVGREGLKGWALAGGGHLGAERLRRSDKMQRLLKRAVSYLPFHYQQELKRLHFGRQIRRGSFRTREKEYDLLDRWVHAGDWVLDVGANIGHYTARLSSLVGPEGRIIAFEPVPASFEILAANLARLPLQNVSLLNVAASSEAAEKTMVIPQLDTGLDNYYEAALDWDGQGAAAAATERRAGRSSASMVPVLCLTIDAFHFPAPIAFVKIDTECHERPVLDGMRRLLERDRPVLMIEANTPDVRPFLEMLGYRATGLPGSANLIYEPLRPRTSRA
jgi:FkbM family methyltransferase